MFRCAQSTEKPKIKTINQSKPEAEKPGAETLGPYTHSLLGYSHVPLPRVRTRVPGGGLFLARAVWTLVGLGCAAREV